MSAAASPARGRAHVTRRALVGAAWMLAWMLVWGCMLLLFASRSNAGPPAPGASPEPASSTSHGTRARGPAKETSR